VLLLLLLLLESDESFVSHGFIIAIAWVRFLIEATKRSENIFRVQPDRFISNKRDQFRHETTFENQSL
jgi:hypothetical protein